MSFLKNIVKSAGKGLKASVKLAVSPVTVTTQIASGKNVGTVLKRQGKNLGELGHAYLSVTMAPGQLAGKVVGKIPVLGTPLSAVIRLAQAPLSLADSIMQGNRLDHAVIANIKQQVKDVKTVGPYVQMVISVVPGVGTVAAGAIGAGIALASGQPIDKIIVAGIRGALPGGAVATTIFDTSQAVLSGKPLAEIGIAALPLDLATKTSIRTSMKLAVDVANGKNVAKSAIEAAQKNLPKEVRVALTVGLAVAEGKRIQLKMLKDVTPSALATLSEQGTAVIATNRIAQAGLRLAKTTDNQKGFKVASSLLRYSSTPMQIVAVRSKLNNEQRIGFDLAAAAHVGASAGPPTQFSDPAAQFAYMATVGVKDASTNMKGEVIATTMTNLAAKPGTMAAAKAVKKSGDVSLWYRVLMHLGLERQI